MSVFQDAPRKQHSHDSSLSHWHPNCKAAHMKVLHKGSAASSGSLSRIVNHDVSNCACLSTILHAILKKMGKSLVSCTCQIPVSSSLQQTVSSQALHCTVTPSMGHSLLCLRVLLTQGQGQLLYQKSVRAKCPLTCLSSCLALRVPVKADQCFLLSSQPFWVPCSLFPLQAGFG